MSSRVWIAQVAGRNLQLRWLDDSGREQRRSTGTKDLKAAELQRKKLEATLLLGRPVEPREPPQKRIVGRPEEQSWEWFKTQYDEKYLSTLRPSSRDHALSRLSVCQEIAQAKTLGDMCNRDRLEAVQRGLLKSRKPWTVKTTFDALLAALRWADRRDWVAKVPSIDRIKTSKIKTMKGRPLSEEEFAKLLEKIPAGLVERIADPSKKKNEKPKTKRKVSVPRPMEIPPEIIDSWDRTIRGYWESGLRRDELMNVSWDDPEKIMPSWDRGPNPVLLIPAAMQKNNSEEEIPMLPGFEVLLLETPEEHRTGWVFNPGSLQSKSGRTPDGARLSGRWVSRVIRKIAMVAEIVTHTQGGKPQYATVHDLRRSCAQRLRLARVDREIIKAVMRHSSWETTERHYAPGSVQQIAGDLRAALKG